jgi:IclR family acetate operon transcriptional repressor
LALRHLTWLNEQTGENAELHLRHEALRVVVEVVSSPHNLRPFAEVGAPLPLHRGAAGKVLLAWLPVGERVALAHASALRFDTGQPFDVARLLVELEEVQALGYASSEGERVAGVSALAAPIFASGGQMAGALTLVAPSVRLGPEQRTRYIPLVGLAAGRVSADLGYARSG